MKFTLSWLKRFLDTDVPLEKITHTLTMIGLEVEEIVDRSQNLASFEVAEIISAEKHPDADKLRVCQVMTSEGIQQIVCGAPNARAGIKVVLAKKDTIIPNGGFKIKKSVIRGVESNGMLCSADELGIGGDSTGIVELGNDATIGESFVKYSGMNDPVIHINITPNRADALGVYGIARDLAAAGIGTLKKLEIPKISSANQSSVNIKIADEIACPFFAIREINGLNNKQTTKWLKDLLDNAGIGSISPLVDVTNYISFTFGQPMHAYDADKLKGNLKIHLLDTPFKFNALNGKEYQLNTDDLVISDENSPQCLAGIIGGVESACDENTNRIILEAASFNRDNITISGRRLMIDTDSRYRFERNVDKAFTLNALEIATAMILEICGGEASAIQTEGNQSTDTRHIEFPLDTLESIGGMKLSADEIQNILTNLGFGCTLNDDRPPSKLAHVRQVQEVDGAQNRNVLNVHEDLSTGTTTQLSTGVEFQKRSNVLNLAIPSWRYDVSIKEDIVEEIVRIHGYDKIPQIVLPNTEVTRIIPKDKKRISDFKRILASRGYDEVVTWSFTDSNLAKNFAELKENLYIHNPISSDLDYMRPNIMPNLLKIAASNLNRSLGDLSFFEIGPVFNDPNSVEVITHVSGIRIGNNLDKNHYSSARKFDVFDIKADLQILLDAAGLAIEKCQISNEVPAYYHPTRSAKLALGKNILGFFGQIHPAILKKFDIDTEVCAFELNISNLPFGKDKLGRKPEFINSNYQVVHRDFAFILDENQAVGEILSFIASIDKAMIKKVTLFDLYMGENIANGKKSIALSTEIQDDSKTLTDEEIKLICNKIINGVTEKFAASIRDS